jgi:hypothetical protein
MLQGPFVSGTGQELRARVLLNLRQGADMIGVSVVADQLLHRMQRDTHRLDVTLDQWGILGCRSIQEDGALLGDDEIRCQPFRPDVVDVSRDPKGLHRRRPVNRIIRVCRRGHS